MVKTELTLESLLIYLQSLNFAELGSNSGILTSEQAQSLQNEIESNYIKLENFVFGQKNNDIRQCLFNFDNPYIFIKLEKIELRVIDGLVEGEPFSGNRKKTHLLYADNQIIGKFYNIADVKSVVRKIDLYYNKTNILSESIGI
jgi:hypothetical protein